MISNDLFKQIAEKRSFLCVGLDTDIEKIPKHFLEMDDPIFEFNKEIINGTKDLAVAYKLNLAFYEVLGEKGMASLKKTVDYIPDEIFTIADAKRGDIGNTSDMYAKTFFETYGFDAVTLSPYMGKDSIMPYLAYKDKWVIILGLTSNEGSEDLQMLKTGENHLYEEVIKKCKKWGTADNMMFVVGATHPEMFSKIRKIVPDHFLLVPGQGAQGGDFTRLTAQGFNKNCGLLVNSSRGIIYAGKGKDFRVKAMKSAFQIQREMELELKTHGLIEK